MKFIRSFLILSSGLVLMVLFQNFDRTVESHGGSSVKTKSISTHSSSVLKPKPFSGPMSFLKYGNGPLVETGALNTFYGTHVMNPSVVQFRNQYHVYFRGYTKAQGDVQTMGVIRSNQSGFDPNDWSGATKLKLDGNIFALKQKYCDPAAVKFQDSILLFISFDCHAVSKIRVYRSFDGVNFTDLGFVKTSLGNIAGGVPAPVVINNRLHLFTGFGKKIRLEAKK